MRKAICTTNIMVNHLVAMIKEKSNQFIYFFLWFPVNAIKLLIIQGCNPSILQFCLDFTYCVYEFEYVIWCWIFDSVLDLTIYKSLSTLVSICASNWYKIKIFRILLMKQTMSCKISSYNSTWSMIIGCFRLIFYLFSDDPNDFSCSIISLSWIYIYIISGLDNIYLLYSMVYAIYSTEKKKLIKQTQNWAN